MSPRRISPARTPTVLRATFLSLLLGLGACTRPEGSRTEILYSFWGSIEQQAVERRVIAAFEKANPDIRVRTLPIGARYPEKIQAMMIGNAAPDVIMVEITLYDEWRSRGVLRDLTPMVRDIKSADPLMPIPERCFSRDGRFHAVPINAHGHVLYVNLDALKRAGIPVPPEGWTWDDLIALGPQLSRRSGNPSAPTDFLMLLPLPEIFFFAHGVQLFDNPALPQKVTVDSPETRAAFQMMRDLHRSGHVVPPDVSDAQGTFQLFRDGKTAFFISGRWSTPEFAGRTAFEWDVVPIPAGPKQRVTAHGGTGLAVWTGSRHVEAAERFIRFYTSSEGIDIVTGGGRYAPVSRSAAYGEKFLSRRPPLSMRRFSETMEDGAARIYLYSKGQVQVMRIVNNRVSQALNMHEVPTDDIVRGLAFDLNRWLERHRSNEAGGPP